MIMVYHQTLDWNRFLSPYTIFTKLLDDRGVPPNMGLEKSFDRLLTKFYSLEGTPKYRSITSVQLYSSTSTTFQYI
jgi:hypothetical protein